MNKSRERKRTRVGASGLQRRRDGEWRWAGGGGGVGVWLRVKNVGGGEEGFSDGSGKGMQSRSKNGGVPRSIRPNQVVS